MYHYLYKIDTCCHEFKEKDADEIPLSDKKKTDIITLMSLLHPPSIELNGKYSYCNILWFYFTILISCRSNETWSLVLTLKNSSATYILKHLLYKLVSYNATEWSIMQYKYIHSNCYFYLKVKSYDSYCHYWGSIKLIKWLRGVRATW